MPDSDTSNANCQTKDKEKPTVTLSEVEDENTLYWGGESPLFYEEERKDDRNIGKQ